MVRTVIIIRHNDLLPAIIGIHFSLVLFIVAEFEEKLKYTHELHLTSNIFQADGKMLCTVIIYFWCIYY